MEGKSLTKLYLATQTKQFITDFHPILFKFIARL